MLKPFEKTSIKGDQSIKVDCSSSSWKCPIRLICWHQHQDGCWNMHAGKKSEFNCIVSWLLYRLLYFAWCKKWEEGREAEIYSLTKTKGSNRTDLHSSKPWKNKWARKVWQSRCSLLDWAYTLQFLLCWHLLQTRKGDSAYRNCHQSLQ